MAFSDSGNIAVLWFAVVVSFTRTAGGLMFFLDFVVLDSTLFCFVLVMYVLENIIDG